jgi:Flp pilus assembly protein TadG
MRLTQRYHRLTVKSHKFVRGLIADIGGFAAVEFAMVVPVMIIMLLGSVEVSDALTVDQRVNIIASSISDVVARTADITPNDLKDITHFGELLIGKYSPSELKTEIISLLPDPVTGAMKVDWSYNTSGSVPYPNGSTYPGNWDGMTSDNNSLIVVNTTFNYNSPIGQYIHGQIKLSHTANNVSRVSKVKCPLC